MSIWTELLATEVRHVAADGVRTRVLLAGAPDGRPLVLLHGRGGHLETFVHNVPAWAAAGRRVIAFDLLGHGLTEPAGTRYDIGELVAHARAVVDLLVPGDFDLVGQSIGGWIAAILAREIPRVGDLVLIEPAGFQSEQDRMADPAVRAAAERGGRAFHQVTPDNVRSRFAELLHDQEGIDPELVELRTALYALPGATDVHRAVRTADNAAWLLHPETVRRPDGRVLVVRGQHGHIPVGLLETVAAAAGGTVLNVEAARQWPHYENPAVVDAAVIRFLEERAA